MIKIWAASDKGCVRYQNQDCFAYKVLDATTAYAIVCDGMGGENAGDVASQTTCKLLDERLSKTVKSTLTESTMRNIISSAIEAANATVYAMAQENPIYVGMGTTVVLIVLIGDKIYMASVGDSRIYATGKNTSLQLTTDHTLVQHMLEQGEINAQQAAVHPQRHFLTRAVGVQSTIDYDYDIYEGFEKDVKLLLCSDGLYNYLTPQEIPKMLKRVVTDDSAQSLIDFANQKGGHDNITAVVVAC